MTAAYYLPDTTGNNPNYTVNNQIYTYFEKGMTLDFPSPIFYDSLVIVSSHDGATWKDQVNYQIGERDYTAESQARNLDANFAGRLVKSITITEDVITPFQISLTYQTFYPTTPTSPVNAIDGTINLTPALISDILKRLMSVEQKSLTVGSSSIPTDAIITPLSEDIDGTNPKNVQTETHSINTFQGQNVIFPQQGAFFKDSVSITVNGTPLVKDTDFIVANFDQYRTRITSNRSGIYHSIVILKDYAGDNVEVTYHAVGGKPTIEDIIRLQASVTDITRFIDGTQYLTSDMLGSDPNIEALISRTARLEKDMRAFMQTPTYGRTTTGTTVARSFKAPDTGLHWWTIGSLYQIDTSNEILTADTMKITIEMPDRHLRADVFLSVDILNPTQPLKISAQNVFYDQGYTPFSNQSAQTPPPVLFRIIYNHTADNASGIYLQVGTSIPTLVERFGITDNSGVESGWYLALPNIADAAVPNDVAPITLPNQTRTWNPTGTQSASATVTLPLDEGYLLFSGNADLNSISAPTVSSTSPFSTQPVIPGWLPLTQCTAVDVFYSEKLSDGTYKRGKITLPAVYDVVRAQLTAQSAVTDFGFTDQSVGTLKITVNSTDLTAFYTGATQASGVFAINYITVHTGKTCDAVVPAVTGQ